MSSITGSIESKVAGAVLGAAIGDALGHPTEFLAYEQLEAKYGAGGVKDYELGWERDGRRFAPYTDDTQLAEVVLRGLLEAGTGEERFDEAMQRIADGVAEWRDHPQGGHRAPGNACFSGATALLSGVPWRESGGANAGGCGSVMRAYPFGIALYREPQRAERWAVEHSRMTHRAPIALAACAAMAVGVAHEMNGASTESTLAAMVDAAGRYEVGTAAMMEGAIDAAHRGEDPVAVLKRLQGWAAHEAIAAAVFVVTRHPHDIRAALLEGANASGDSDSIATLAGGLLGARHGVEALPESWVRNIERSEELLALAEKLAALAGA